MLLYTCDACRHGEHKYCAGKNPPPPGVFGGSECDCDGKCAERAKRTPAEQTADFLETLRREQESS